LSVLSTPAGNIAQLRAPRTVPRCPAGSLQKLLLCKSFQPRPEREVEPTWTDWTSMIRSRVGATSPPEGFALPSRLLSEERPREASLFVCGQVLGRFQDSSTAPRPLAAIFSRSESRRFAHSNSPAYSRSVIARFACPACREVRVPREPDASLGRRLALMSWWFSPLCSSLPRSASSRSRVSLLTSAAGSSSSRHRPSIAGESTGA
jgi:hypothetical protein